MYFFVWWKQVTVQFWLSCGWTPSARWRPRCPCVLAAPDTITSSTFASRHVSVVQSNHIKISRNIHCAFIFISHSNIFVFHWPTTYNYEPVRSCQSHTITFFFFIIFVSHQTNHCFVLGRRATGDVLLSASFPVSAFVVRGHMKSPLKKMTSMKRFLFCLQLLF